MDRMDSIPTDIKDVLSRLEYLALIKKNYKPCTKDMSFVLKDSWAGWWKNHFHGNTQQAMMNYIESTIEISIRILKQKTQFDKLILDALTRAKNGVLCLIETYKDFPITVTSLRVCVNNIDIQLK